MSEYGVRDYVILFRDPDSDYEIVHLGGSDAWIVGACMQAIDQTKGDPWGEVETEEAEEWEEDEGPEFE